MATRTKHTVPVKRVTTGLVLHPRVLAVLQAVAAHRGATGRGEETEGGVKRPYSVSALIRELIAERLPLLEGELKKTGIRVPK